MDLYIGKTTLGLPVADLAKGHGQLNMTKTLPGHLDGRGVAGLIQDQLSASDLSELESQLGGSISGSTNVPQESFTSMLMKAIDETNHRQNEVDFLTQQAIVNPDSVDVHEVTIAIAKANMTLSVSKAIIDRSINGFKDILNQR